MLDKVENPAAQERGEAELQVIETSEPTRTEINYQVVDGGE